MFTESSNHEEEFENNVCDVIGFVGTCCSWRNSTLSQGTCFQVSTRTNTASHTSVFGVVWADNKSKEWLKAARHVWTLPTRKALNRGSTRKVHLMLARPLLLKTLEEDSLLIQRQGPKAARTFAD